ncbi:LysR family transcriptional regulator [Aquabacter sp. CN5-332]|uniref:LysR family transcriptional regulator n=1 Tax=Aquabacter sp. CN5-332 TaxID=3156608 RepID=UPI0032B4D98D
MNSKQLELFVAIAEAGSLSRAAIALHRAQPILSREIRDLENGLGSPLFHRTGRGVVLTESGRRLLPRARRILDELAQAESEARSYGPASLTSATIAMPTTLGRTMLGPLTSAIYEQYGHIHLHLLEGTSAPIVEWLMARRLDVAIFYDTVMMPLLSTEQLCEETMYLVASAKAPRLPPTVPVSELERLPLILPGPLEGLRLLVEVVAAQAGIRLNVRIEADAFNSIRLLMEAGHGYSVLPYAAVQAELERGVLQVAQLVEPEVKRRLVLATCPARLSASSLNELVRLLKSVMQKTMTSPPLVEAN